MFTVGSCVLKTKEGRPLTQAVQEWIQESYPQYKCLDVDGAVRCDTAEIDDEMVDHWGEHWKHLKVLAASQGGKEMLCVSKYYVKKAESNGKPIINMVIVSDNGKHRSVGMADLLRHCLIHSHGWDEGHSPGGAVWLLGHTLQCLRGLRGAQGGTTARACVQNGA